jgi:hypothetical protein
VSAPFDLPRVDSFRNPQVTPRTTLVIKLMMLIPTPPGVPERVHREHLTEFLDDLTEYIRDET